MQVGYHQTSEKKHLFHSLDFFLGQEVQDFCFLRFETVHTHIQYILHIFTHYGNVTTIPAKPLKAHYENNYLYYEVFSDRLFRYPDKLANHVVGLTNMKSLNSELLKAGQQTSNN